MADVFSDPCVTVRLDRKSGILHYVRTAAPYPSLTEFVALHARLGQVLDRLGRDKHTLLVDMRRATMNNDPAFERAAETSRRHLVRGFARVAVLVHTAVGALQVKRHVREDGREIGVFEDELTARTFLTGHDGEPRRGSPNPSGQGELETPPTSRVELSDGPFQGLGRRPGRRGTGSR